jgi:hypothetical protein
VRRTLCAISLALLCSALVPAASTSRPAGGAPRRVSRSAAGKGFQPSLALRLWKQLTGGYRTMDNPPPPLPTPSPVLDLHSPIPQ